MCLERLQQVHHADIELFIPQKQFKNMRVASPEMECVDFPLDKTFSAAEVLLGQGDCSVKVIKPDVFSIAHVLKCSGERRTTSHSSCQCSPDSLSVNFIADMNEHTRLMIFRVCPYVCLFMTE